ncbi:MAG: nucleotide-binding protein [Corallococcus sp.]|nr:nucleotide-binding protein [Bacillota bacterium]MCM1533676.1 nucleotide-binding protein [Corallococcus sp.]
MKDKIFLIWSGDNEIALKVKAILEGDHNYVCYVGGNHSNDSQMLSIGDTVLRQMKSCNQAIVFFQNKADSGISNNLFFELGYVSSNYGLKKVHCVKRKGDAIVLPSDFDNAFVEELDASDSDEYAINIVQYFLGRQKLSVDTNKMFLVNNRYMIHEMLQVHYSDIGSKCSDYELAQYVMFYMQAAVMFQDQEKALSELKEFKRLHNTEFSSELNQAVNLSIAFLEIQVSLIAENDLVYLDDTAFRKYFTVCKDMVEDIRDDDSGTFDEWARVIVSENLANVCTLYALNPKIQSEMRKQLLERVMRYGEMCISFIVSLEEKTPSKENNDSIGFIAMFRAYIYRHLFNASLHVRKEESEKWLKLSLKERKNLLRNFDNNSIDSQIYSNFEMEYYLNLVEFLEFYDKEEIDPFDYMMYLSDLDAFISNFENRNNTYAYVQKIVNQRKNLS